MPTWSDIRYFQPHEFDARDISGKRISGTGMRMSLDFVAKLDKLRDVLGFPLTITCGMRTEERNEDVGGVKDSAHMSGHGVDIAVDSRTRFKIVEAICKLELFNRIGIVNYPKHIHLDDDSSKPPNVLF